MKISIASDLHLEFGDINVPNHDSADVLILSGDICVAEDIGKPDPNNFMEGTRSNRITDFFKRCSFQFPHVIYVLGNHEHYHGDFVTTGQRIQDMLNYNCLSNVHLLDRQTREINDVTFIGGTLWTDMNNQDPVTLFHMKSMMNDFRCVRNGNNRRFLPEDAVIEHKKFIDYVRLTVEGRWNQKFVVAGHHSPSRLSTHEQYRDDTIMNGGYSSSLDEFIMDHPQIRLWTHGHTHHDFDYMIGSTRVVCNPRGYDGYEARADQWQLKTVEV